MNCLAYRFSRFCSTAFCLGLVSIISSESAVLHAQATARPLLTSQYVSGYDGTELAIDLWLPQPKIDGQDKLPAIVEFTRYWRSAQTPNRQPSDTISHFVKNGYVFMIVDARGTGASFGSRNTEFSPEEVKDMGAIIAWAARQPWSNGRVATLGTSYAGNAAELAAIAAGPELRAVVPRFSDFSAYRHAVRPGGLRNRVIADSWITYTRALDANQICNAVIVPICDPDEMPILRAVDDDANGARLAKAVDAHKANTDLTQIVDALVYSDDPFGGTLPVRQTLESVSPAKWWKKIDSARVPSYHWASWFDGGTAEGVLTRYINYRSPMRVILGPWTHGGALQAQTGGSSNPPSQARPSPSNQLEMIQAFLDPIMKTDPPILSKNGREIEYYTLGRGSWSKTEVWPPVHISPKTYFFAADGMLSENAPSIAVSRDQYKIDPTVTSGSTNRWHTQLGAPIIYPDRRNSALLSYTTLPFEQTVELTGSASVKIELESTHTSGALFAYLEQVAADGSVSYLTEGQISLNFHGPIPPAEDFETLGPTHRFLRKDSRPIHPGEPISLNFSLHPISVELPRGSSLRLSIAAADADTFEDALDRSVLGTLSILREKSRASFIKLPLAVIQNDKE